MIYMYLKEKEFDNNMHLNSGKLTTLPPPIARRGHEDRPKDARILGEASHLDVRGHLAVVSTKTKGLTWCVEMRQAASERFKCMLVTAGCILCNDPYEVAVY